MLQLLRAVYPQSCLITEIVSVEGGNYIIRALAQIEGVTIATGFAVSSDLEIAQDKALERVLKILGVEVNSVSELPLPIGDRTGDNGKNLPALNHNLTDQTAFHSLTPNDLPLDPSATTASLSEVAIDSAPKAVTSNLVTDQSPVKPSVTTLPTQSLDNSYLQTQILMEMERLGWTTQQGRDYLEAKYGKKTRKALSDAEVLEFCTYLQSLP
jgi:hypothetical protein